MTTTTLTGNLTRDPEIRYTLTDRRRRCSASPCTVAPRTE